MDRKAHAFFCEDIRQEVGGKCSYMGVWGPAVIVPQLPFTFPKLCVAVRVVTSRDQPFKKMRVRVLKNSELVMDANIQEEFLRQVEAASKASESGVPIPSDNDLDAPYPSVTANFHVELVNFPVERPCHILVRVDTELGTLRAGSIRIKSASTPARSESTAAQL